MAPHDWKQDQCAYEMIQYVSERRTILNERGMGLLNRLRKR
jgi:hypothetical protein